MSVTATMPAAVFAGDGVLSIETRLVPAVERGDEVILDVEACGICGTDLQILSVPPGHPANVGVILGHEIVGVVSDVGPEVQALRRGDRVVVAPNLSCGQCVWCRRGLRNQCESFTTHGISLDGGLAPHARVPAAACHPISREVPASLAALAEPLSTVVQGVLLAAPVPGETAVVIGAGPVGLMFTALLRLAGTTVITAEPAPERRELARALGADEVLDPLRGGVGALAHELTAGLGADIVVDAVGSQFRTALDSVRKAGRIVLFGVNANARCEVSQYEITRNELSILGAYVGQDVLPRAIALLEQERLDLRPMVTHRIGLEALPATVEELRSGRAVKVEVEFS